MHQDNADNKAKVLATARKAVSSYNQEHRGLDSK